MENSIKGYKAFNADLTNRYGMSFEVGKEYSVDGNAVFGNHGNGFHFCERLEDTLRYFDAINGEVSFAEVVGSGNMVEYSDEFYGYYDMYAATELKVLRILNSTTHSDAPCLRIIGWYKFIKIFKIYLEL